MENEEIIVHQFLNEAFFLPNWPIHTLVLGTFNPKCGEQTDYFYGRCQNNFWRTIEELHNLDYMWFQNNLERKLKFMRDNEFGCTDVIKSIIKSDYIDKKEICGSGYKDKILFTAKKCKLTYQFEEIKSFISNKNIKRVINTWGKRNSPRKFMQHLTDLDKFCTAKDVQFVRSCPSSSGWLKNKKHKEILLNFYKDNLTKPAHNNV